jgi:hypothetical protein
MSMQQLQLRQIRVPVEDARAHVIDLDLSPVQEERSTPGTPALLVLEQDGDPAHRQRVLTQPVGTSTRGHR